MFDMTKINIFSDVNAMSSKGKSSKLKLNIPINEEFKDEDNTVYMVMKKLTMNSIRDSCGDFVLKNNIIKGGIGLDTKKKKNTIMIDSSTASPLLAKSLNSNITKKSSFFKS